ncbi:MAG TPA: DNA translocase FtsK 4TM domain-containing protein [Myxococcales bacterium]|nr:DNA translocase FtsK 4TM domain-containing protein [Myxococcales bacterium]
MARAKKAAGRPKEAPWKQPAAGILLAGAAAVTLLGLWSYGPRAPEANWAGPVGHAVAGGLLEIAGAGAYAIALAVIAVAAGLVAGRPRVSISNGASWLLFCLSLMALVHLGVHSRVQGHAPGGLVGALIAGGARAALSTWGAAVLIGAIGAAALVVATDLWALRAAFAAGRLGFAGGAQAVKGAAEAISRVRAAGSAAGEDEDEPFEADPDVRIVLEPRERDAAIRLGLAQEAPQDPRVSVPPPSDPGRKKRAPGPSSIPPGALAEALPMAPTIVEPRPPPRGASRKEEKKEEHEIAGAGFTLHGGRKSFTPPPIGILTGEAGAIGPIDRDGLTATAEKLRQKLASFGIQGQVTQIRPGPVVTMFEFLPAAGVKVSRIASLADDLAMAMEALRVRIVAPIPGRGVVGIEVPNKERQMVVLRELAEQEAFQKSHSKLAMCLGKDIEGMPYIADLGRMPHLLIAGTTGSGKSVAVNSMIVSMLLRASPEEVRFLMVDPKMLELSVYEGIPHLLLPVVTDAKKAAMALRWAVEEMERRYQLLAECGVRNIASFNKKVEKEGDGARRPQKPAKEKRVVDLTDPQLSLEAALGATSEAGAAPDATGEGEQTADPLRKLPYLVIIIDELADLMMVASREVETYIARLAQMARAAGIHLMVATQRPSTDVVTGVIKANFPARISFQVASRHDSATIINSPGAENLLGMGDMLILPPGTSTLTRVHGPYVDEKEIHAVVEHWKAQGAPVYDPNILRPRAEDGEGMPEDDEGPDELYDQAIAAVADMRFISISLLQRKLRVGYNRAARMIERMEREGIVGPADGAKPREVLIRAVGDLPGAGA